MTNESTGYNVEPTAKVIDEMAEELELKAKELRRIAAEMRESKAFDGASEALSTIGSVTRNMRLDLLVMRPLRALGVK